MFSGVPKWSLAAQPSSALLSCAPQCIIQVAQNKSRRGTKVLFLLAGLCTLSFVAGLSAERYVIAYMPFGGGWSSRIVFNNPTDQAINVELLFFSGDGSPLNLTESAAPMSRQIRLGPGAAQSVDVAGAQDGESQVGWAIAKADSDSPLQIFASSVESVGKLWFW